MQDIMLQVRCSGHALSGFWKRQHIREEKKRSDFDSDCEMPFSVETKGYSCGPVCREEEPLWREIEQAKKQRVRLNLRPRKSRSSLWTVNACSPTKRASAAWTWLQNNLMIFLNRKMPALHTQPYTGYLISCIQQYSAASVSGVLQVKCWCLYSVYLATALFISLFEQLGKTQAHTILYTYRTGKFCFSWLVQQYCLTRTADLWCITVLSTVGHFCSGIWKLCFRKCTRGKGCLTVAKICFAVNPNTQQCKAELLRH